MYKNIGKKIKVFAQIWGYVGVISGAILAVYFLSQRYQYERMIGWISLGGGFVMFLSSLPLFCMGQIVDDLHILRQIAEKDTVSTSEELPKL